VNQYCKWNINKSHNTTTNDHMEAMDSWYVDSFILNHGNLC